MTLRSLWMLVIAGAVSPLSAYAGTDTSQIGQSYVATPNGGADLAAPQLTLDPLKAAAQAPAAPAAQPAPAAPMLTLDAGGSASRIHGFGTFSINSQYITPRGLIAEKKSPQFQSVVGLVFDLYSGDGFINDVSVVGGIWGDFNTHPDLSVVTGGDIVTEVDLFTGVNVKFAKNFEMDYTIMAWTFPDLTSGHNEIDPTTEYNMDWKFSYNDTDLLHDFALHPYVDFFWNFTGKDSPVVANALLGKNDHTFYVEIGICPSYTLKAMPDLPITFSMPTYVQVGDSSFWGETPGGSRSNLGIFSTGLKASVPLTFIPKDFGSWNAFVGVTYDHTCNPALTYINSGAGGGSGNLVLGYAGFGFGF